MLPVGSQEDIELYFYRNLILTYVCILIPAGGHNNVFVYKSHLIMQRCHPAFDI